MYAYRNVLTTAEHCLGGVAGKTVLEVGCGRGATLREFARRGAHTFGLDYSEEALQICAALQAKDRPTADGTFVNGDARSLPFPSDSFDFVFSVGLIEHFEEPLELLFEQCRVLKPEGHLLVQVPQKYSAYTVVKKLFIVLGKWPYGGWETQFSERQLRDLVAEAGLEAKYVSGYGSFVLAAVRHSLIPTLDFGMFWRNGTELDFIRALKTKTALDLCIVARKGAPTEEDELPK
jgi:SAM-dependent methyltransferase